MQIEIRKPVARGVTELAYVGSADGATPDATPDAREIALGALAAYVAYKSKGIVRLGAAGIAAVIGLRALGRTV